MRKFRKYLALAGLVAILGILLTSCKEFLNPEQELNITEDMLFDDWYEYRAVAMGMYGLQQNLAEQLFILGELRGDLVEVTDAATADMVEIQNFSVSKTNKFASPTALFRLISACNNFIRVLQEEHPEVMDPDSPVTNYDRLYGEALCMRAWAYFNGVRIYGKVPYIYESLVTYEEVNDFVNSSGSYIDSVYIKFSVDGYYNDTLLNHPVELEKQYMNTEMVIDHYSEQLENDVKAVGVNHYFENDDISWEVTIWSHWAMSALLGQMYLTRGDLAMAASHFEDIIYSSSENYRYQLDQTFAGGNWRSIFDGIDNREHIYTIWFNKSNFQQNQFQSFFEPWPPHKYMLKPTYQAIFKWETQWRNQRMNYVSFDPLSSEWIFRGIPSDFLRGIGSSYLYVNNGVSITENQYFNMIMLRADEDERNSRAIMDGMDTMIFKYSVNKNVFDQDANYIIYRAGGIHLYLAEIYVYWAAQRGDLIRTDTDMAEAVMNDGSNYSPRPDREQLGVRGRIGLGDSNDGIFMSDDNFTFDPYTNKILGYSSLSGKFQAKQRLFEQRIMDERARELAFEGERFYDLMRVAQRRNDPAFLAKAVSSKFPPGRRDVIYTKLLDESNWYINYFDEE